MSLKINFAPEGTVANDYIVDFGQGYSIDQGFGWVKQSTLRNENPTPIDISLNTRDRDLANDSPEDSLIHLQYPSEFAEYEPVGNPRPSAWEYTLANGLYEVTVSVGDANFLDSNHVINLEGKSAIDGFVPTEDNKFATATTLVEITDGKLTLDARGGENTKLNFVEIASANSVKVNFGVASINPPAGYIQDIGNAYSEERGFGWITEESVGTSQTVPLSVVKNGRDRNTSVSTNLDTLIHLQYPDSYNNINSETTAAAWEYELANGKYLVTVDVGDANFADSNHVINVEGNQFISGFTATPNNLFKSKTRLVNVADGKLTVDAIGGENTKINSIEITPFSRINDDNNVVNEPSVPEDGTNINFGTAVTAAPDGFLQDIGQGFDAQRGFGWVTQNSLGTSEAQPINIVANGRDRNSLTQNTALDSLIHLQYATGLGNSPDAVTTAAAWEYELANGRYTVTVSVGDADFTDSNHVLNVEGENAVSGNGLSGFQPDSVSGDLFFTGTVTVEVTDDRLTIDAIGGENTKLNYISIVPVDSELTISEV